jgi:hypothetical protein
MSLENTYYLRYESKNMKDRVTAAISKSAGDIKNEDPGTPNHENRIEWANFAFANTQSLADQAMWDVVWNPAINAAGEASTDNDIQFAVNTWVNENIPIPPPTV